MSGWLFSAGLFAACASAQSANHHLPADVQTFVERREMCEHFRGEIPGPDDAVRMEAVESQIERYCASIDRELASLKAKYPNHAGVMEALDGYEGRIEPDR